MRESYRSPLEGRYASAAMRRVFSEDFKFFCWRRLWLILAEAQQQLGLDITDEQLDEMRNHLTDINYSAAEERERDVRHDVMAHIYAFGLQCRAASPIIHMGATSCYVGDNADILMIHAALDIIERRLVGIITSLAQFSEKYKDLAALGYTHFQPAQPTTMGKRATLWLNDLLSDLLDLRVLRKTVLPLGSKGATGTQASFLELFDGDEEKVFALDDIIAKKLEFPRCVAVSGQTYSRKQDYRVLALLSSIAQSACKFANDIRLLQHLREVFEPFAQDQIGSSAMPYKRNPMLCERMTSLGRFVISNTQNAAMTAQAQWLERTLDDSANRRLSLSEGFLCADAVLLLYQKIADGLQVDERAIAAHLERELPVLASETLLMDCVKRGLNRQEVHARLKELVFEAERVGKSLQELIVADPLLGITREALTALLSAGHFTGLAARQTERFLGEWIQPVIAGCARATDEEEIQI